MADATECVITSSEVYTKFFVPCRLYMIAQTCNGIGGMVSQVPVLDGCSVSRRCRVKFSQPGERWRESLQSHICGGLHAPM